MSFFTLFQLSFFTASYSYMTIAAKLITKNTTTSIPVKSKKPLMSIEHTPITFLFRLIKKSIGQIKIEYDKNLVRNRKILVCI